MAYNGIVPGPEIRVTEGDKVRVVCKNEMKQSTSIHFHGVLVPNAMDGVPYITQPPIKTGETFTYEFTAKNSGSHMYHSHHNAAEQVTKGLMAPFIIEPKDKSKEPKADADYNMVLNDKRHRSDHQWQIVPLHAAHHRQTRAEDSRPLYERRFAHSPDALARTAATRHT